MSEFFTVFISASLTLLCQMAPSLLLGFFIAGLLSVFISPEYVRKQLGNGGVKSVLKAALFGIPLPLCSCGVLPVAAALRKQGASKGSVSSFLISTPQTGVDSIFVTYSLLGLTYAVFRPIAAFFSGLIGGLATEYLAADKQPQNITQSSEKEDGRQKTKEGNKFLKALHYAFIELMDDIAPSFLAGLFIAALISILIPGSWLGSTVGTGIFSMFVMMLIGIPLYVCATASVPIAAALMAKGISPGAALVFLMTGPATNAAAITAIMKMMGKKSTVIYLLSIASTAIISGMVLDMIYEKAPLLSNVMCHEHDKLSIFEIAGGIILGLLILNSILKIFIIQKIKGMSMKSANPEKITIEVKGMSCAHCRKTVEEAASSVKGVKKAEVELGKAKLYIIYADDLGENDKKHILEEVKKAVVSRGFEAL